MNNIPEDSTLRRHYLTEQKYKLQKDAEIKPNSCHIYYTAAFIFLMALLFL